MRRDRRVVLGLCINPAERAQGIGTTLFVKCLRCPEGGGYSIVTGEAHLVRTWLVELESLYMHTHIVQVCRGASLATAAPSGQAASG